MRISNDYLHFREFFAHRLILSASSQYFKAMFNSGMEECKSGKVDLPDVTSLSMDLILNAIYRQVRLSTFVS